MEHTYIQKLKWRYATKKFDPSKKLSGEQLDLLKQSFVLAPSSFGLQPWKLFVVSDEGVRERLREAAFGQPQITEASHIFVLASKTDLSEEYVDKYMKDVAEKKGVPIENLKGFRDMILGFVSGREKGEVDAWCKEQTHIALGFVLSAAAQNGIDACPMGGFDPGKFDEILGIEGYTSSVLCAIGFRKENDEVASMKKVRFDEKKVVEEV